MKSIYLETLGCSKNQVDSEKIMAFLEKTGYIVTEDPQEADIIIVNTCGFIQAAKEESIETIFNLAEYKKKGTCKKLIIAGCMAQYYSDVLKEEIPEADIIFGVGDLSKIADAIKNDKGVLIPSHTEDNLFERKLLNYPGSAYLKISDGCSNHCSYCIIPKIRGELRSRKIENILKELDNIKKQNIKEIILIAQDTANYGLDFYNKKALTKLIDEIESTIKNDTWIRLLYMHPDHVDKNLLSTLKNFKHFIPYFDIPFQSGSANVLKNMNRKGNSEIYLKLIDDIRNTFSDAVIRSTFIAGFPGETESDFAETIDFIKKAEIEWVGAFTYSNEEGTKASEIKTQIDEKIKLERLHKIFNLSDKITKKRIERFIGTEQKILIEEKVEGENLYIGRFWGQAPEVDGLTVVSSANELKLTPGTFIDAKIKKLNDKDFFAVC